MNDFSEAKDKATVQYGFVRANWGKLSFIVVPAMIVAFVIGAMVF